MPFVPTLNQSTRVRFPSGRGSLLKPAQARWLAVLVGVGPLVSHASKVKADDSLDAPASSEASAHFEAGNEAFSRGDTHEAYRQYAAAWERNKVFDVACNLGRAEAELGKLPLAAEHLSFCLANFSASPRPEVQSARARYAELFRTVRAQVATLAVQAKPDGAELLIDEVQVATLPLATPLYLRPGAHALTLRLQGYTDLRRNLPVAAGEARELSLELEPLGSAPNQPSAPAGGMAADAAPSVSGSPDSASATALGTRRIVLLTGGVLSVTGAALGVGFYLQGRKLDDEASSLRAYIGEQSDGATACSGATTSSCEQLTDTIERRDRAFNVSTIGFAALGVFGLGTLAAMYFWRPATEAQASLAPWATATGAGVTLGGRL